MSGLSAREVSAYVRIEDASFAARYRAALASLTPSDDLQRDLELIDRRDDRCDRDVVVKFAAAISAIADCFQQHAGDYSVLGKFVEHVVDVLDRVAHVLAPSSLAGTESVGAPRRGSGDLRAEGNTTGGAR